MDEHKIGLVLARISELRSEITNCIHQSSTNGDKDEFVYGNGVSDVQSEAADDEAAVDCLLYIRHALESLEAQVSSLQALQEQQWYEKEAALAEIGHSQEKLLQTLKGYKGKDFEVIHEAISFVSETVQDNNDLLLPPYPSRPSRTRMPDKGYGAHLSSALKFTQNGVISGQKQKDFDEANRELSETKSPLKLVKLFMSAAAKTALTVVGVISVLNLAGFEPQLRKGDNQLKVLNLFQQLTNNRKVTLKCPPGKVPVIENGETRCIVKERVEIPFESVVTNPDVNYGCG